VISGEQIRAYHYDVGEDYFDQGNDEAGALFNKWLANKYPEHSEAIAEISEYTGDTIAAYEYDAVLGFDEEKDIDIVYVEYAKFCTQYPQLCPKAYKILEEYK
jgi:hypothetical protein